MSAAGGGGWSPDERRVLEGLRRRAARRRLAIDRRRPTEGVVGDDVPVATGQRLRGVPGPSAVGELVAQVLDREDWGRRLAAAGVHDRWDEIVGDQLARRCRPVAIRGDVLVLEAESPPWAVELRHLERDLVRGVRRVLDVEVARVEVRVAGRGPGGGRA